MDLSAPLKVAPKLIAPEPGQRPSSSAATSSADEYALSQNTVPAQNRILPVKEMHAPAVRTRRYARQPRRVQILTSPP